MLPFDAGALDGERGLDAAEGRGHDGAGGLVGRQAGLDLVGDEARAGSARKGQAAAVDVGDDERAGAAARRQMAVTRADGAGAAHQHGVAQARLGALQAGQRHRQRLQQRALLVAHVADLVAPRGRVVDVAPQQPRHRRRRQEVDGLAAVVPPRQARRARAADHLRLHGHAVAHPGGSSRLGCTATTSPADSWPSTCVSLTTMSPMLPRCQKWMSDLSARERERAPAPGDRAWPCCCLPAYPRAADGDRHLAREQARAALDAGQVGLGPRRSTGRGWGSCTRRCWAWTPSPAPGPARRAPRRSSWLDGASAGAWVAYLDGAGRTGQNNKRTCVLRTRCTPTELSCRRSFSLLKCVAACVPREGDCVPISHPPSWRESTAISASTSVLPNDLLCVGRMLGHFLGNSTR